MNPPTNPAESGASSTPDAAVRDVDALAREVLRDNYLHFGVEHLDVHENDRVRARVRLSRSHGDVLEISGEGVGLIDAVFDGIMKAWAGEYPSLKTISVADFHVASGFDSAQGRRSDALAVATLRVRNAEGAEFEFVHGSPSVTRSSVHAAVDALTFFVNSERAYVQLHLALQDARARRRSDLVDKYRRQMSTLVQATSYSEVIEKLREGE